MADSKKEFLILLRLIVRIGPGKKLKRIITEMHRHFPKDSPPEINSMVEVLCGGEYHLRVLDVARIQVYRTFHGFGLRKTGPEFFFELVGLPFDVGEVVGIDQTLKGKKYAFNEVAHLAGIVIG